MGAGALGASISGAGPTMFAITPDAVIGHAVALAMREAHVQLQIECSTIVTTIDVHGTIVTTQ